MSGLSTKRLELLKKLSTLPQGPDLPLALGKLAGAKPLAPELCTEDRLVPGCTARLWMASSFAGGRCHYECASDSRLVQAVAGVLCEFYSGARPEDILACDPSFLRSAGLTAHLTANRRIALSRVWKIIREFAEAQGRQTESNDPQKRNRE